MTEEEVESQSTSYHHQTMLPSSAAPWPSCAADVSYELVVVAAVVVFAVVVA